MMRTFSLAGRVFSGQLRSWTTWLALALLATGPAMMAAASSVAWSPAAQAGGASSAGGLGSLWGLYVGTKLVVNCHHLTSRLPSAQMLSFRLGILLLCILLYSLAGLLGGAAVQPLTSGALSEVLWRAAILSAVGVLSLAILPGQGLPFLAAVALAWWIPAILPPELQLAAPRGLRGLLGGGWGTWVPQSPRAWLADTTLFVGLLLLAWASRRPIFEVDEVRDPG
jgi:hypothetical protein